MSATQKIVSFVPSLTETFIECGLNVVGRTRFCIHPQKAVKSIPALGGTKDFNREVLLEINPDLVILDKEENKKELYDFLSLNGVEVFVFHVTSLKTLSEDLYRLASQIKSKKLLQLSKSAKQISDQKASVDRTKFFQNSISNWTSEVQAQIDQANNEQNIEYIIWKNPWMGIGPETFIADVLSCAGVQLNQKEKYPVLSESQLIQKFCLFSSEPYPFHKKSDDIRQAGLKGCLIDGEKISWYGIRTIQFLESCISTE